MKKLEEDTMNATPRPWTAHINSDDHDVAYLYESTSNNVLEAVIVLSPPNHKALASIVQAVNAYDRLQADNARLREALIELLCWVQTGTPEQAGAVCTTLEDAKDQVEAALDAGKETIPTHNENEW